MLNSKGASIETWETRNIIYKVFLQALFVLVPWDLSES